MWIVRKITGRFGVDIFIVFGNGGRFGIDPSSDRNFLSADGFSRSSSSGISSLVMRFRSSPWTDFPGSGAPPESLHCNIAGVTFVSQTHHGTLSSSSSELAGYRAPKTEAPWRAPYRRTTLRDKTEQDKRENGVRYVSFACGSCCLFFCSGKYTAMILIVPARCRSPL